MSYDPGAHLTQPLPDRRRARRPARQEPAGTQQHRRPGARRTPDRSDPRPSTVAPRRRPRRRLHDRYLPERDRRMTTTWRCTNGHEYTSPKRQTQCAYGRCAGTPVAVRGPLAPKKEKAK